MSSKAIISNGHFKFILAPLAAEVARHGKLALFLTGAYPSPAMIRRFGGRKTGPRGFQRFVARQEPGIPPELVRAKNVSELFVQAGRLVKKVTGRTAWGERLELLGMRQYGRSAVHDVATAAAGIYHFRSAYGHASVSAAQRRGFVTICDHSLPNPEVMDYLIANGGAWPAKATDGPRDPWSELMLPDLREADYLVVNSDFVKESFVRYGWDPERIFVHYTGVDDDFMGELEAKGGREARGGLEARGERLGARGQKGGGQRAEGRLPRLLFAGELSRRKGTDVLLAALGRLPDLRLEMEFVGDVHEDVAEAVRIAKADSRAVWAPFMPRKQLAERMAAAEIFVFPSLAEGSARVVFMALAAGCYVITTPNSGSIVRDGVHGRVVAPGNVEALAEALRWAMAHRAEVAAVGEQNSALVRKDFRQAAYGRQTLGLYQNLQTVP